MRRLKRLTALLLAILMLLPAQGMTVLADTGTTKTGTNQETVESTERIEETLPLEPITETLQLEPIMETLPLEPITVWDEDLIIYWNPGDKLPEQLASASNATGGTKATPSNAKPGSDRADGRSPERPVKTLAAALERAEQLREDRGAETSEITIYAMNPMEIADGQLYVLNAGNIRIASWPKRTYNNDTIFYVNGGQLSLVNTMLTSGKTDADPEDTELLLVHGGTVQLGKEVEIEGRIIMDYQSHKEETDWELASSSNAAAASASNARKNDKKADGDAVTFNIEEYILDTDADVTDLIEDSVTASTWREPIIELIEGFEGLNEAYLLEVRIDGGKNRVEVVQTLYADETTAEEFAEYFTLYDEDDHEWKLAAETTEVATVRDTGASDFAAYQGLMSAASDLVDNVRSGETETLTIKSLSAIRPLAAGDPIYWNPGDGFTAANGDIANAGDDINFSGSGPDAPVRTWAKAVELANGGTIVCMRSITLGSSEADANLPKQGDSYLLESPSLIARVTLRVWEAEPHPAFIIPEGETLTLKNIVLESIPEATNGTRTIYCQKGQIIIEQNVIAKTGYIAIETHPGMKAKPPVMANSYGQAGDGDITLFFEGINFDLTYRNVDVVEPGPALAGQDDATVGQELNKRFKLHQDHRSKENEGEDQGKSDYEWGLRPDTAEDDGIVNARNLELYTIYYYSAIYLNGVDGKNEYYGTNCLYPVETWERAVEIWEDQMALSIQARADNAGGKSKIQLDALYPLPKTIYICDTVTIDSAAGSWKLREWTDYDGSLIKTEVVSHNDAQLKEGGSVRHELPKVLVCIENGGSVTFEDLTVRNITDEGDSVSVQVKSGGSFTVTGKTMLTGERKAEGSVTAKAYTNGTHVRVEDGGTFLMPASWSGSITARQQGVAVNGSSGLVTMDGGKISNNNAVDAEAYQSGSAIGHKRGAGVALSGGATFVMNAGEISGNTAYQYGGGVYLNGNDTTFKMYGGKISDNLTDKNRPYNGSSDYLSSYGMGIYGGTGTVIEIDGSSGSQPTISGNSIKWGQGAGIWSDGILKITKAVVSGNVMNGSNDWEASESYGIGICVSDNGFLQMEDTDVTGNIKNGRRTVYGIGVSVLNTTNDNFIRNSRITGQADNYADVYSANSYGGGVFAGGKLTIDGNSKINGNSATYGGGIGYVNYLSYGWTKEGVLLTIADTDISSNNGKYSGGGISLSGKARMNIKDGVTITLNEAQSGGAIHLVGIENIFDPASTDIQVYMMAEQPDGIAITGNEVTNYGGGIYIDKATLRADNVRIASNIADRDDGYDGSGTGGGYYSADYSYGLFRNTTFENNHARLDGGGLYLIEGAYSRVYMRDCKVVENTANRDGGGFYMGGQGYLTESTAGAFVFKDNHAGNHGGGICRTSDDSSVITQYFNIDIAGDIQNSAGVQGSNLYLRNSNVTFLSGTLKAQAGAPDIYNMYIDTKVHGSLYLDMSKVSIVKNTGSNGPKVVFLNTGNSFLTYLAAPLGNTAGQFPIDVNDKFFKEGSIVIKPAKQTSTQMLYPETTMVNITSYNADHGLLSDASINLLYSDGGDLPRRTTLGPFKLNDTHTNAIIVGEGIYLSSSGDDLINSGLTPDDPVATFAVAKQKLEEQIIAKQSGKGFMPIIYICGEVKIDAPEPAWNLPFDDPLFETTNQAYITTERNDGFPVHDAQVRRFASFVNRPMINVTDTWTAGHIIIDGMAEAVIITDQRQYSPIVDATGGTVILNGNTELRNNYYYGVKLSGSTLQMSGVNGDKNRQIANIHGTSVYMADGSVLEMTGESKILSDGAPKAKVGTLNADAVVVRGQNNSILMQGKSQIVTEGSSHLRFNDAINSAASDTTIEMQDFAKISYVKRGIFFDGAATGQIMMNATGSPQPEDMAMILADTAGIELSESGNLEVVMAQDARIVGSSTGKSSGKGIRLNSSGSAGNVNVELNDNARITGWQDGIYLDVGRTPASPLTFKMNSEASIDNNSRSGIYENGTYFGYNALEIKLLGNAKIKNNNGYGLYLVGAAEINEANTNQYRRISLANTAAIEGNKNAGIYSENKFDLTLSDTSKICGNGSSDNDPYGSSHGIHMLRNQGSLYSPGTATVTIKDGASICDNRGGGIYTTSTSDDRYPNLVVVTLDGSGSMTPSIKDNSNAITLGKDVTLKLEGSTFVGASNTTVNADGRSVVAHGKIELDGLSIVDGPIWLRSSLNPITMTNPVNDPNREYHLWLAEGFLGNVVVKPNDPDGLAGGMTDVTNQIQYFIKDGADGRANAKNLIQLAPNIVLEGENNVYLSGYGHDSNDGNSPDTAVRSFKVARERLETGPFTTGANIIICRAPVEVELFDYEWSFEPGGYVTNNGVSWKPLVKRYEEYSGVMISLPNKTGAYAPTVILRDITIDGGSEDGLFRAGIDMYDPEGNEGGSQIITVDGGRTAKLEAGAVLQNNRKSDVSFSAKGLGVYVLKGTLILNGGTIQNMAAEGGTEDVSAVYLKEGDTSNFVFNSGRITDNRSDSNVSGSVLSTIRIDKKATAEMNGGVINNNINQSANASDPGAAIYVNAGNFKMTNGTISDNKGGAGSALYYYNWRDQGSWDGSVILSGGVITGNTHTSKEAKRAFSPVYVAGNDFQLQGGGCDIRDFIYLNDAQKSIIKVSGAITQRNRVYHVYLNSGGSSLQYFKKASTVVQPDGTVMNDVTPYLANFEIHANTLILDRGRTDKAAGTVTGNQEKNCLILMHAIFLDSENGSDRLPNNGSTPALAVASFDMAKMRGEGGLNDDWGTTKDYYIIYISGMAKNQPDVTWSLPEPAYMCRYTGFNVYDVNDEPTGTGKPYYGVMIDAAGNLTLEGISIYGRRAIDTIQNKGDSIVRVHSGVTLTVQDAAGRETVIGRNYNFGSYLGNDGVLADLSENGGAVQVLKGGTLAMTSGTILEAESPRGGAVYLGADTTDQSQSAVFIVSGKPSVNGTVYLGGEGSATYTVVSPDATYLPSLPLMITVANDFNNRPVVIYRDGSDEGPTLAQMDYYQFEDSIKALYDIVKSGTDKKQIILSQRQVYYLDGTRASSGNGLTPDTAFCSLKDLYTTINGSTLTSDGIIVYVSGTVPVEAGEDIKLTNIKVEADNEIRYQGFYSDQTIGTPIPVDGQVSFKRYSQPRAAGELTGYGQSSLKNTLFRIEDGGQLTLSGIYVDGHSQAAETEAKELKADGVVAQSPLITVEKGGILNCVPAEAGLVTDGVRTLTQLANNVNDFDKSQADNKDTLYHIGDIRTGKIYEGSSAGIEILGGKKGGAIVTLNRTQFRNLELQDVTSGGSDIYNFGELRISYQVGFGGSVYLEGFGVEEDSATHDSSCKIIVEVYGKPTESIFQVKMRDPYNGRKVVYYEPEDKVSYEIKDEEIGLYHLEERVKKHFYLGKKSETEPWYLVLHVPAAVYVAAHGDDNDNSATAGATPAHPVATLRRAYQLLKNRGGDRIYVVGTTRISGEVKMTGMSYWDDQINETIRLGGTDRVNIIRYIQPDAAASLGSDYSVPDFSGVMLEIEPDAEVSFSDNMFIDGHSEKKESEHDTTETTVMHNSTSLAPMIEVKKGGTLHLLDGVTLHDNNNATSPAQPGQEGGVVYNSGTTYVNGALFKNNEAEKGSAVYQDGVFTIQKNPNNLSGHSFYLTAKQAVDGTWSDHVIQTEVLIPEGLIYDVDMDHPVAGRDVVRFMNTSAYDPDVDSEHKHFQLGSTVTSVRPELFLVVAEDDPMVLELQNWRILNVEVPSDIYLVIRRRGSNDSAVSLAGVHNDGRSEVLSAANYQIKNLGNYKVKVSVSGFENQNDSAGITAKGHDKMILVDSPALALGNKDLYLAIAGLDSTDGFTMEETSLKPYAEATPAAPALMGTLAPKTEGNFTFKGAVGTGFITNYIDLDFPLSGKTNAEVQKYMDGDGDPDEVNARAKYVMKYKVEIDRSE